MINNQIYDLPDFPETKPSVPATLAREQGFYSSILTGGGNDDAVAIAQNLEFTGEDSRFNQAREEYRTDLDYLNQRVVADIISDPSVDRETRKSVVTNYLENRAFDPELRIKYRDSVAATPNVKDSRSLEEVQDIIVNTLRERDNLAQEQQNLINSFTASLSGEFAGVVGGITRDVFPLTAPIINIQSATMAGELRTDPFAELKAALFSGSNSDAINNKYKALPLEQKKEFLAQIISILNTFPGTDYNKFEKFNDIILHQDMADWEIILENVGSVLNLAGLKGLVFTPVKYLKELFLPTSFGKKAPDISPSGTPIFREEPTPSSLGDLVPVKKSTERVIEGEFVPGRQGITQEQPRIAHHVTDINSVPPKGEKLADDIVDAEYAPMFYEEAPAKNIREVVRPRVNPTGPLGTTATANPGKAQSIGRTIAEEVSTTGDSQTARTMGSSPGEVISDWSLPKLDDSDLYFPDINKDLKELDGIMEGLFKETKTSSYLSQLFNKEEELETLLESLRANKSPAYQQSNSIYNPGLFQSTGTAVFGRTPSYGWSTRQQAQSHIDNLVGLPGDVKVTTFEKNGQWYIGADYTIKHDPLSNKLFGGDSISASFLGMDASGLARLTNGIIFPPSMRLPDWVTKGAFSASLQTKRLEKEFINVLKKEITPLRNNKAFAKLLDDTQENQKWYTNREIKDAFPELSAKEIEKITRGYNFFHRLSEYEYNWANRYDRALKESKGHQAIYSDTGALLGYGTKTYPQKALDDATLVWDFAFNAPVRKPSNLDDIVALESPIRIGNRIYEFANIGSGSKLGPLPNRTLNKIEGYIPRRNKENWYITSSFREMDINGRKVTDSNTLNNYSNVIGAASTKKEALQLVEELQKQFPDRKINFKRERGDTADSIRMDNVLNAEMSTYSRTRGERLFTLEGKARLEDPLVSFVDSLKSMSRLNMWQDYNQFFQKNFVQAFNKFLPDHTYPNSLSDIRQVKNPSPTDIKEYKVAQQLFEYKRDIEFKRTTSDELWKTVFHEVADVFEKIPFKGLSESTREVANLGAVPVKAVKTLSSTLFLHLNPLRQWIVQNQQIIELSIMNPRWGAEAASQIPAFLLAVNAHAPMAKGYRKAMLEAAKKASLMNPKEFDDTLDALIKNGIPESVDLNMMLHGMFDDVTRAINESMGRRVWEGTKNFIKLPGTIGKNVGYGPAELTNTISTWLFAKDRWITNNPGKDWRKHTAEISGDAWDINHSMATRAGALPYQDGILSPLFQFAAVQHKAFLQVFSSRTLTGQEKAKLAAARAFLFGIQGVPAGMGIAALVYGLDPSPEVKAAIEQARGGFADWFTNNFIDYITNDPIDELENIPSNLAISPSISPLPETVPYWDFFMELKKLTDNSPVNPRFAFIGSMGSVYEAAKDIRSFFAVNDLSTEEALKIAGLEMMEAASGGNNFAKYMMLKNFGDKADRLGRTYGLNIAEKNIMAQLFGITTWEELNLHELRNIQFERIDYIESRAKEIHEGLSKYRDKVGTEDYFEFRRRQRILNSFSDPDLVDEIERRVDKMVQFNVRSKKENVYRYIMDHYKDKNDKYMNEMLGILEASPNPQDKEFLRRLKREGVQ